MFLKFTVLPTSYLKYHQTAGKSYMLSHSRLYASPRFQLSHQHYSRLKTHQRDCDSKKRKMDGPPENDVCSICHANFHIPCQSNCGHWFCGSCILRVWEFGSALHPCKCPLCRREITLLVPGEASLRRQQMDDVAEILQRIERYNRLHGQHTNGLIQKMRDLPFLLKRLLRDMSDPQRSLPFVIKLRVYSAMILSVIYVLSPVDFIPEAVLGVFGLLDDLIIVFICFLHVAALYRAVLLARHGGS